MSWVITNRKDAELGGADMEQDRVLIAVTPAYVAERYRDYVDQQQPSGPEQDRDPWDELSPERRQEIIATVDSFCDRHLSVIDNAISGIFAKADRDSEDPPNS